MVKFHLMVATGLLAAMPAAAQTAPATSGATALDPARLTLAHSVVDTVFPPAQRGAMMTAMVNGIMHNMEAGIMQQPDFQQAMAKQPKAKPVFQAFVERQHQATIAELQQNMPGLLDAMAQAYARHFNADQLTKMRTFFASPTGQAYVQESVSIMSDPAVAAWQQKVAGDAMKRMPAEMTKLKADLKAAGVTDTP